MRITSLQDLKAIYRNMGELGYTPSIAYPELKKEIKARNTFISNYRVDTDRYNEDIVYLFSKNDIIIFELRWIYGNQETEDNIQNIDG